MPYRYPHRKKFRLGHEPRKRTEEEMMEEFRDVERENSEYWLRRERLEQSGIRHYGRF